MKTIKNSCGGKKKKGCSLVKTTKIVEFPYYTPIKKAA